MKTKVKTTSPWDYPRPTNTDELKNSKLKSQLKSSEFIEDKWLSFLPSIWFKLDFYFNVNVVLGDEHGLSYAVRELLSLLMGTESVLKITNKEELKTADEVSLASQKADYYYLYYLLELISLSFVTIHNNYWQRLNLALKSRLKNSPAFGE